jgi:hypothetical protein
MFSSRIRHWPRLAAAVLLSPPSAWAAPTNPETQPKPRASAREQLGEEAELARATGLYDTGQYAACVDAFERLLGLDEPRRLRSPAQIEAARTYHGACLIGMGRTPDAERVFRDAILENPQMKAPDGLLFPEAVVEVFLRVRESMLDEIRRVEQQRMQDAEARADREQQLRERERWRIEQLVAIAEKETIIERRSRWIATIPFGVGQFQNGHSGLGWLFLVSETAASGVLVGSLYMKASYEAKMAGNEISPGDFNAGTATALTLQKVGGFSLLGLALVGITEAHLSFVPEVRIERTRSLPQELRLPSTKSSSVQPALALRVLPWAGEGTVGGAVFGAF